MRSFVVLFILASFAGLSACAGNQPPGGVAGAPAAPAAVERFLQLAAVRDYAAMGWLFGTDGGPIMNRDPLPEVEQRMYALAQILQHDGFVVGNGTSVPGRGVEAVLFDVILNRGSQTFRVPITAVRGSQSRWYVEQLDVEAITGR